MVVQADFPIIPFANGSEWEEWLEKNHKTAKGVWMQFFKKSSGVPTITWVEAVEVALCFGWIDSQAKKHDEKSYLQRFTPRNPRSIWSKINTEHVARLTKLGKMKPAGLAAVEAAKADGRWDRAYDSPAMMKVPDYFLKEVNKNEKAKAFFETLSKSNTYAIAWRLQTAKKPETRERRMKLLIEMLEKGEKLH
jgi:uncharacterized protein YdeI (YjbR/CyaY-like superfamily)